MNAEMLGCAEILVPKEFDSVLSELIRLAKMVDDFAELRYQADLVERLWRQAPF